MKNAWKYKYLFTVCSGCGSYDCCDTDIDIVQLSNKLRVKASKIRSYCKSANSLDYDDLIQYLSNSKNCQFDQSAK